MRRAVIDIGTNTVKLLVADIRDGKVLPVVAKDATTRLGEGVAATRHLSRVAIARTVQTIADYAADAREHGAIEIIALTTSAARDADNRQEFLDAVRAKTGLTVEVITGQREAELIFRGVASDPAFAGGRLLVMDIGGGSAEFILGQAGMIEHLHSLPLGAVRLTEQFPDFADLAEFLRATLYRELAGFSDARLIATGGTITTLASICRASGPLAERERRQASRLPYNAHVDHATFTLDEVRALVLKLHAMPLDQRRQVPGLPPERADIIVAGGAVVLFAMEALGVYELTVSVRNLRYGALLD
jgi:exopolyphosphatase/guanosine-5'-triphosphate,3'-diphosphate pyrophosphatase